MKKVGYALFTCTLTYAIAALVLFIWSVALTGWSRIDSDASSVLISGLTLALSEFEGWGDFYYLAVLAPWLGSTLLLVLLLARRGGEAKQRRLLGGVSIGAYYLVMFMVFIIGGLVHGWGDVAYLLLIIWPVVGFGLGYLAAFIADKTLKLRFTA